MLKLKSAFTFFLFVFVFSMSSHAYSLTTLHRLFAENPQPSFIEVHNNGNGEEAIYDALSLGFPKIFIIDITQYAYERNVDLFGSYSNIFIELGDPTEILTGILEQSQARALIWFDGTSKPLVIQELRGMAKINSRNNTILIEHFEDYTRDIQKQIIKIIQEINPRYHISKRTVFLYGTVLVAKIKPNKLDDHSSSDRHDHHGSSGKHHDHCSSDNRHHNSSDHHHHGSSGKHHHHKHK